MLSRLARSSRCLRQPLRPLRLRSSYSSETVLSALSTAERFPSEWLPRKQALKLSQGDYVASTERAHTSAVKESVPLVHSLSAMPLPSRYLEQSEIPTPRQSLDTVNQRRVRKAKRKTLRYVGLERPRALRKSSSGTLVQINRIRRLRLSDSLSSHREATTGSLQKYLNSPLLVSLGSWPPGVDAPSNHAEHHEHGQMIDEIDFSWSRRVMRLEAGHRLKVWKTTGIEQFADKYTALLQRSWLRVPIHDRCNRWQDAMVWCLQRSPRQALALLLATFRGRAFRPPRHMVQACLQLLARHYLVNVPEVNSTAKRIIWRLTCKFMDGASPDELRSYAISQDVVQIMVKHCNNSEVLLLYKRLISNRADLHVNTMLHFLSRFVDMGKLHTSMSLLQTICSRAVGSRSSFASGVDLSQDQIQAACVKLLRSHWGVGEPYPIQSKMLTQMLEMGIRPNTALYNAILLNMIEGRDFETAWQTYDIAKQSHHFATDAITYGILAKGAKLSGDYNILEKVLRDTSEDRNVLLQSTRLISSILDAICHFSPNEEFEAMLKYYKQHLDLRPLQELGLYNPEKEAAHHDAHEKWPTKYILGQMILAYNRCHASSDNLIHRYKLYLDFVERRHPLIAPLAQDDYVANSFLLAFGKRSETLQHCTTVVKHMLSNPSSKDSPPHASPTVRTWSILLSTYMRHRQTFAAEKVLTMMRARGLEPDVVTWNTIISGYAAMQDIEGAVGAMRRMEAEGLQSNAKTLKGLGRLQDRARLLRLLEDGLESPASVELKHLASTEEVEAMAEGWETNVGSKNLEIQGYLQSFNERNTLV